MVLDAPITSDTPKVVEVSWVNQYTITTLNNIIIARYVRVLTNEREAISICGMYIEYSRAYDHQKVP
jgi:hypothetical protein